MSLAQAVKQPPTKAFVEQQCKFSWRGEEEGGSEMPPILLPAGMELMFFPAAGAVPCLGFGLRTALITHCGFDVAEQCLHKVKDFEELGVMGEKSWEEAQPGELTRTGHRAVPQGERNQHLAF